MKSVLFVIGLLAVACGSPESGSDPDILKAELMAPFTKPRLRPGFLWQANVLTEGIGNPSARIDRKKGVVEITFDFVDQRWTVDRNMSDETFFTLPLPMVARLVDQTGQELARDEIKLLFFPSAARERILSNNRQKPAMTTVESWETFPDEHILGKKGNIVSFKFNARDIDYASKVQIGFSTKKRVHEQNIWKPHQK